MKQPLALRIGGLATGFVCLAWAIGGVTWRNSAGDLTAAGCFPLTCAAAAFLLASAAHTEWRRALAWFGVAAIGQAASLQMIEAGHSLHYQHYPPVATLVSTHPWMLTVVILQTLAVAGALVWPGSPRLAAALKPALSWRWMAALVLSLATSATVSPNVVRYVAELGFASYLQLLSIATVALGAFSVPEESLQSLQRRLGRVFGADHPADQPGVTGLDRFGWTAAAVATVLAVALSALSYQRHPHVPDEVAYLYHARYFAAGMLTMPAAPVPAAFDIDLMTYEPTRWFSSVSPGWPAVLAVGVLAGVPWLVNALLAGINVLLAYLLLQHLYSRRVARYGAALLAVSPWYVFLAMSLMTEMITLTCALTAALGVLRARRTGAFGAGVLAGAAVGAVGLVRPVDGLVIGSLMALWSLGLGGSRLRIASLSGLFAGTVAAGSVVLAYNAHLTGHPLQFPVNAYFDRYYHVNANAYGFGPERGMGWPIDPNRGHGPVDGVINANLNLFGLNTDLFGWSTGSLVLVALLLCSGRLNRSDRLMLATIAAVVAAYFFYWFSGGPDFGARYWFMSILPLVALTVRGMQALERVATERANLLVVALSAMSLVNFVPWRAVDKYHHFRGMRADMRSLASEHPFAGDLVLVRGSRAPDYSSAVVENPIDLTAPDSTVYAWDKDAGVRAALLRAYPARRVWLVDGPSITRSGYRITAGPIDAAVLLGEALR